MEAVDECPVCRGRAREPLHLELQDLVFASPGRWNMYRCTECWCGYLDPRPTQSEIGRYYDNYYTHAPAHGGSTGSARSGLLARIRHSLGNGYRNWRFGTHLTPASRLGILAAAASPRLRRSVAYSLRDLRLGIGARVLDVGFGDGTFLRTAESAGWEAWGLDVDPVVVAAGRSAGLNVRLGGLGTVELPESFFDAITLCHVLEHLHHPRDALAHALRLLRPGGALWIDTPNLESLGHQWFGRDWRGLEPPRHLVVFSRQGLELVLRQTGFTVLQFFDRSDVARGMFSASREIREKRLAAVPAGISWPPAGVARLASKAFPRLAEFVGVLAERPA